DEAVGQILWRPDARRLGRPGDDTATYESGGGGPRNTRIAASGHEIPTERPHRGKPSIPLRGRVAHPGLRAARGGVRTVGVGGGCARNRAGLHVAVAAWPTAVGRTARKRRWRGARVAAGWSRRTGSASRRW